MIWYSLYCGLDFQKLSSLHKYMSALISSPIVNRGSWRTIICMVMLLINHARLLPAVHPVYGQIRKVDCLFYAVRVTNGAMQQGVVETSTDAIGRTRSMMAYWEVVVSLGHQDMLGSCHQRIMAMRLL